MTNKPFRDDPSKYGNRGFGTPGFGAPGYGTTNYQPGMQPYVTPQQNGKTRKERSAIALRYSIGFVVIIWVIQIINMLTGGLLSYFGIHPLDVTSLPYIFTSPFLHGSIGHISANTVPAAIFIFLVALSGRKVFWEVTLIVAIIGGLGTWLLGGVGTNHIGASGLIYGWLAYLIVRGLFNRHFGEVLVGLVLAFIYGGLIWGVLPQGGGISWQGHLFGAAGGLAAGAFLSSDDPEPLARKRALKKAEKNARNGRQI